ncbi:hypothetical protein PHYPSEUDO_014665 [Phytophthora pseudosyringae]|uniref:Uncharacterized protein n=1 Tax=Phytophthora pseudosyringae TaxID=221518 RepID=A0A8T1W150_9STRA|nr:hypothetical protein PHYPSEUDO_014665 [Phytophthora pseudosyringae]
MDRQRIEREVAQLASRLDAGTSSLNAKDVDKGLHLLDEVDTYLTRSVFGDCLTADDVEPNVIVLGTTGAGKGTVVSFLFGEGRLLVRHESRYSRVLVADPPLPGVAIRSGVTSSTLLPIVNHIRHEDGPVAVWDMPGIRDTRGPFVELVVHFIFRWMLKDDKPLKFVIVSPPLHERPQAVMLQSMINGSLIHRDNAVVVYTKCGRDFDPDSTSDLKLDESKRNIRSFALPAAAKDDSAGQDYSLQYCARKRDILDALSRLRSRKVTYDGKLPDAAKLLLDSITKTCVKFVQDTLSACFLKVYKWDGYRGTYEEMNTILEVLKCTDAMSLETMIDILSRMVPDGSDQIRYDPEFLRASHRLSILETLNGTETRRYSTDWLRTDCVQALEDAKVKLLELQNALKAYHHICKLDEIPNTLVISAFHLCLSDKQERIKKFVKKREKAIDSAETIPKVILVGYSSLDVDVDLQMWANIALISPSIDVTMPHGFNLSVNGQAKSVPKLNVVAGQDGIHGIAGLPGGNLTVACQRLKDDSHKLRSTISRGQRGGDAQNGGDGTHGEDSSYTKVVFEKAVESEIKRGLLLEDDFTVPRELRGGLQLVKFKRDDSPLTGRVLGTPGKKYLKIRKESESGKPRTPAGSGGQGGEGGRGGNILIMQQTQNVWEGAGPSGEKGHDGAPGGESHDGYSSPSFTATVQEWYLKGGLFGDSIAEPEINVHADDIKPEDQPKLMRAKLSQGQEGSAAMNGGLDLTFVKGVYQFLRARVEDEFPQCDFGDLKIGWESGDTLGREE